MAGPKHSRDLVSDAVSDLAFGSLHEAAVAPPWAYGPTLEIRSAKVVAQRTNAPVRVIKTALLPVSGVRHGIAQVWGPPDGDHGKIIGDDGNNLTLMLQNAGRVVCPREDFDRIFERVSDTELAFRDPDDPGV